MIKKGDIVRCATIQSKYSTKEMQFIFLNHKYLVQEIRGNSIDVRDIETKRTPGWYSIDFFTPMPELSKNIRVL